MGIVVACRCGQGFEADVWLAGKVVQCPACRSPIAIPTPAPEVPPAAAYVPRPRAVSRESNEATQSIATILVGGGILCVVVLGLSTAILCYVQGKNPLAQIADLREQGKREREARWAARLGDAKEQQSSPPSGDGPIPIARTPAASALPEGWGYFEYPNGKFRAVFPAQPEYIERTVESVGGDHTYCTMSLARYDHLYQATREIHSSPFGPLGSVSDFEGHLRVCVAELDGGILEGVKNFEVNGRKACDAILRGKEGDAPIRKYLRLVAYENAVFELSCRVPVGKERPAEISAFLANYQLP